MQTRIRVVQKLADMPEQLENELLQHNCLSMLHEHRQVVPGARSLLQGTYCVTGCSKRLPGTRNRKARTICVIGKAHNIAAFATLSHTLCSSCEASMTALVITRGSESTTSRRHRGAQCSVEARAGSFTLLHAESNWPALLHMQSPHNEQHQQ